MGQELRTESKALADTLGDGERGFLGLVALFTRRAT